ncbi:DUF2218 domain-containing protein [Actinospica durhamensis]|uniref:DUF2218 domain-containing protein n=1 Tax=Actinospica durhamensis TaxID=1508375 RepID=A0A941EUB2_9ACTN|nr:DUF2218 domain-containing protein [Actinospica durhamensis]MBR7836598.1 DUF2218 domain-containing protein [Actinospica durhamensis]
MPTADARITTDRAERYLEQLCSHLGAMGHMRHVPASGHGGAEVARVEHVEKSATGAVIRFAEGCWVLDATPDALILRVEAEDPATLERLKASIAARIAKIGRRDGLTVAWSQSAAADTHDGPHRSHGATANAEADPEPARRRRWRQAGWLAVVALAVAVHLGLIGSLLGPGRWKDAAADAILAILGIKLVLVALHVRSRRSAAGGS